MLPADSEAGARLAAKPIRDSRASHYWDGGRHLAREMGRALGISDTESVPLGDGIGAAWDVYLAYAAGDTDIRTPRLWMHQLAVTHAPRLDAGVFIETIRGLLAS